MAIGALVDPAPSGGGRGRRRPALLAVVVQGLGLALPALVARLRVLPRLFVRRRGRPRGQERDVPQPHPHARPRAAARSCLRRLQRAPELGRARGVRRRRPPGDGDRRRAARSPGRGLPRRSPGSPGCSCCCAATVAGSRPRRSGRHASTPEGPGTPVGIAPSGGRRGRVACDRMSTATGAPAPYAIPQEFEDFRETIRKIVVEQVAPRAAEIDEKAEYPHDIRELFASHDLMGLPFDERARRHRHRDADAQHRGRGGRQGVRLVRPDPDDPGARDAADEAVRHRRAEAALPAAAARSGEWIPAFALSEPDAGSDPGGMRTKAVRDGDEWVIDGTKNWITNLGIADFYICFAVTDPDAGPLAAGSPRSWSRPTGPASRSASSRRRWGSRARPPASRSSTTSASRPRT